MGKIDWVVLKAEEAEAMRGLGMAMLDMGLEWGRGIEG